MQFMSMHCPLTCGRCHNKAGFGGLSSDLMMLKAGGTGYGGVAAELV